MTQSELFIESVDSSRLMTSWLGVNSGLDETWDCSIILNILGSDA